MNYNYHTHTFRCHHATGTAEEYIKRAINNGIKYMGFSDHMPLKHPDGNESKFRVAVDEVEEYRDEILNLKEKYKEKIEIILGFEMEYFPEIFDSMLENAKKWGGEYLILGQHFTAPEYIDKAHCSLTLNDGDKLKLYSDLVVEAIKTGVFTYVAHPDVFKFDGDDKTYINEMRKICIASREYNIPLEINFLGIRTNRHYPKDIFWQIAGEEKSPVTFGFDAHDVLGAFDSESLKTAKEMVEKYNLNYIGKPQIRDIRFLKST